MEAATTVAPTEAHAGQGQQGLRQRGQAQEAAAPQQPPVPAGFPPQDKSNRKNRQKTCCRSFMASPTYKLLILAIMSVVPVFGNLMAMPRILRLRGCVGLLCRIRHYAFTLWISVQFLYNFMLTQFTDAGGCNKVQPTQEATGQFELSLSDGKEDGEIPSLLYAPSWCELCQHWKPPRSHHCSICQRCVLRMDHHCPITGNCIGMRNHGHFVLMYVFAILGLTYSVAVCSMAIIWGDFRIRLGTVNELALRKLQEELLSTTRSVGGIIGLAIPVLLQVVRAVGLEITLQMVFTCIAFITVLSCGLPAISMVGSGATMLEMHFPMKEYVQIKPQVYCPLGPGFYARGWRQNFKDLLGARWWLRLLLPTRGGPVDLGPAVAPRPSPAGVAALRQRCVQVEEQGVKHHVSSCKELGFDPGPGATNGAV